MLIISRYIGEDIVIGDPQNPTAVVRVLAVRNRKGDPKIRLAVEADSAVQINRGEVAERIIAEGRARKPNSGAMTSNPTPA